MDVKFSNVKNKASDKVLIIIYGVILYPLTAFLGWQILRGAWPTGSLGWNLANWFYPGISCYPSLPKKITVFMKFKTLFNINHTLSVNNGIGNTIIITLMDLADVAITVLVAFLIITILIFLIKHTYNHKNSAKSYLFNQSVFLTAIDFLIFTIVIGVWLVIHQIVWSAYGILAIIFIIVVLWIFGSGDGDNSYWLGYLAGSMYSDSDHHHYY